MTLKDLAESVGADIKPQALADLEGRYAAADGRPLERQLCGLHQKYENARVTKLAIESLAVLRDNVGGHILLSPQALEGFYRLQLWGGDDIPEMDRQRLLSAFAAAEAAGQSGAIEPLLAYLGGPDVTNDIARGFIRFSLAGLRA